MKAALRLQQPQQFGDRTIIPVISETLVCHDRGMAGELRPVALLIGEGGTWGIALIEGDSVMALIEDLVLPG
jgi:hypothetical protein